jgi:ACR3 family arsenite transporter
VHQVTNNPTIIITMANQPIDDPAVLPAKTSNTAADSPALRSSGDAEKQATQEDTRPAKKTSAFKSLGWLDRFLAVWILLAMVLGVLLGNFVPEVGPALQKGKFADVSIPIGMSPTLSSLASQLTDGDSCRAAGDDVSHPL